MTVTESDKVIKRVERDKRHRREKSVKINNSMLHESVSGFLEEKIPYLFIIEPVNKSNTHFFLTSPSYRSFL